MSRDIGTLNTAEVAKSHVEPVLLVSLYFDTPVYVHTGVGSLTHNSNIYTGVGDLGSVEGLEESEQLSPGPLRLTLSGVTPEYLNEALDPGNYGDIVTLNYGYLDISGAFVESPWDRWSGRFENANLELGESNNSVTVIARNDLSSINEKSGRRNSDEDHQREYPGDNFFSYIHGVAKQTLLWGGQTIHPTPTGPGPLIPGSERPVDD